MNGLDAITRVSQFLADQFEGDEFARWGQPDLFSAFRYALSQVALARPSTFNGEVEVSLREGIMQMLPPCCARMTDTVDNLRPVSRLAQRLVSRKVVCPQNANAAYRPTSYAYDQDRAQDAFFISPPVPKGAEGTTLRIFCDRIPNPQSLGEDVAMTAPVEACVIDLMIFYICSAETESATQARAAEAHLGSAMKFLGIDMRNSDTTYRRKVEEIRNGIPG